MINKVAPGKVRCRNRQCMRHTKNKNGICDRCEDLLLGKVKSKLKRFNHKWKKWPKSAWQKKAESVWKVMSEVVRLRDTDANGFGKCIATGKPIWYYKDLNGKVRSNCDAGHYVSRGVKSIMFDLNNVHAQFRKHNRDQGEQKQGYRENLIKKIGLPEVQRLEKSEKMWGIAKSKMNEIELEEIRKELVRMKRDLLHSKNWA